MAEVLLFASTVLLRGGGPSNVISSNKLRPLLPKSSKSVFVLTLWDVKVTHKLENNLWRLDPLIQDRQRLETYLRVVPVCLFAYFLPCVIY